ncbi:MAG: polysaccharide deacetylase family protein, partial [Campylobacterota bacterium]|nr:polysaccharide deacetylase family protein [Campylobacterota bacterium]
MRILLKLFIYILIIKSVLYSEIQEYELDDNLSSAVVFMYHRFGDDRYPSTNIHLEQFEQHLNYIKDNNFKVWHLSKIVNYILQNKKIPHKTVALTIDDAYITTYTNAYPRLKAKNFPFTVFVSTRAIDSKSKNYMSWEQMQEMGLNGAEFANHSLTHQYLLPEKSETKESWKKRFINEVENAQKRLQEKLGISTNKNPKLFSYPFGEYNQEMANLLKKLGYVGITQTSGVVNSRSDLRALP